MAFLNPLANAFGLDIGDRTFKIVQTSRKRGRGGYRITAWGSVDVPEGVMERGDIKDKEQAAACLSRLVGSVHGRLSGRAAVACLPEAQTFVKILTIPGGSDPAVLEKAVTAEIEQNIPLPIGDIYYDWQFIDLEAEPVLPDGVTIVPGAIPGALPGAAPAPAPRRARVLLGAAPKSLVDDYVALMDKAGLAPLAFEIEATAISRAIIPETQAGNEAVGIVDIGATRSSLVICDAGVLQMSISIPISGIGITKTVSDALGIGMDDAEKLKRECGLDASRCEDKMWKILQPLIDDMSEKIRNALRFYQIGFPDGKKIEHVYLCGGGAQFHEIDSVLSRKLTIKVRRGDALANIDKRLPHGFAGDASLQYATAIGLAIRAAQERGMPDVHVTPKT